MCGSQRTTFKFTTTDVSIAVASWPTGIPLSVSYLWINVLVDGDDIILVGTCLAACFADCVIKACMHTVNMSHTVFVVVSPGIIVQTASCTFVQVVVV